MTRWTLQCCGAERLGRSGHGVVSLPDIAWPILGCLVSAPHHRTSRSRLAGQMWGERGEESARHCLATSLWRIKNALAGTGTLIRAEGETIALALDRDLWIDAVVLERRLSAAVAAPDRLADAVERRRLAHALRLYGGHFLADREQEWIMLHRARLRALYLDALYALTVGAARAGAWREAQASAARLCTAEPLREDAQRLLMEAHARCGNRALALQQYRQCEAMLAQELGVTPMRETRALAAMIGAVDLAQDVATIVPAAAMPGRAALVEARGKVVETLRIIDRALSS